MATVKGFCPNGHVIEAFVAAEDVRRVGEEGVALYSSIADLTCDRCGLPIDAVAEPDQGEGTDRG